ncbi:MAG: hypothetical protein U1F43_02380 [Myxococcota bacterium]
MSDRAIHRIAVATLGLAAGLACGVAACGDAVVDGTWPGEALFQLEGWVELEAGTSTLLGDGHRDQGELRVGIFWTPTKGTDFQLETAVEQEVSTAGTFPARFTVTLYEPPPDSLLHAVADGSGQVAQALLLAYLDQDGDGQWDRASEILVGGAAQRVILYTPDGIVSDALGTLGPGFHRVVPTGVCDSGAGARFAADTEADIDLTVSMAFPVDALLDVNCDGKKDEWSGVCPPLENVRLRCGDPAVEPVMCASCTAYLWTPGSDVAACDQWFDKCLSVYFAPNECESEWHICRGEPVSVDPSCGDLACQCKGVYTDCLASGYAEDVCRPKYDSCVGQ